VILSSSSPCKCWNWRQDPVGLRFKIGVTFFTLYASEAETPLPLGFCDDVWADAARSTPPRPIFHSYNTRNRERKQPPASFKFCSKSVLLKTRQPWKSSRSKTLSGEGQYGEHTEKTEIKVGWMNLKLRKTEKWTQTMDRSWELLVSLYHIGLFLQEEQNCFIEVVRYQWQEKAKFYSYNRVKFWICGVELSYS
jgi:hypothetical protein